MASLTLQLQNGRRKTFALEEGEIILGRGEDCDISIDNFSISTKHAKFVRHGNLVMIEDLGSSNGTYVNDDKTIEVQLEEGDRIQMGMLKFTFSLKAGGGDASVDDLLGSLFGDDSAGDSSGSNRVSAGSILPAAPTSRKKKAAPPLDEAAAALTAEDALSSIETLSMEEVASAPPVSDAASPRKSADPFANVSAEAAAVSVQGALTGAPPGKKSSDTAKIALSTDTALREGQFSPSAAPRASENSQATPLAEGAMPPKINFAKKGKKSRKVKGGGLLGQIKGMFSK